RLFDRHLPYARLLDDADDLADPLGAGLVDAARAKALVPTGPAADRLQQRLGLLAEQRQQEQVLLARGEILGLLADRFQLGGRLLLGRSAQERDRPLDGRV